MLSKFRRSIAVLFICCTLLFTAQKASAFWDEFGTYTPQIISTAVGGSGAIAAAVSGTFLGLTPIGWAGIGLALLASVMLTSDTNGKKVAVVVSTRNSNDDPNPDLAITPSTTLSGTYYAPLINGIAYPYVYATYNEVQAGSASGTAPAFLRFTSRLIPQLSTLGYNVVLPSGLGATWSVYQYTDSYCPSGSCWTVSSVAGVAGASYAYNTGSCPVGLVCRTITAGTTTTPGYTSLYIPMRVTVGQDCPAGSSFDYSVGSCITAPSESSLSDGICKVSWAANGCPIKNPFDPDCAGVNLTMSCGSSTVPPSVTVYDPATGKSLKTERPALPTQGTPNSVKLTERTPDVSNGTTTERVTTTTPSPTPGQAPTTNGSGQQTYPGTGTNTSPNPVNSVVVSNWPQGLDSLAGYLQIIAGNTAPGNQPVPPAPVVVVPDRMKIDGEGHTESDAPDAALKAAELQAKPGSFMDTLKSKVNPFSNFAPPEHSAQCPSVAINWHAWNLSIDVNSNAICEILEKPDYKPVIQSMMILLYTITAIMIVLGA